jgi:hypothetical protein
VIGALNPVAVFYAIRTASAVGGNVAGFMVGATTFTAVNTLGGALGGGAGEIFDYEFAGGSLSDLGQDMGTGAIIGFSSGFLPWSDYGDYGDTYFIFQ